MSHVDSKDEVMEEILDSPRKTDDSKESENPKKEHKNDDYNDYEVSDDENLDDKEW